MDGILDSLIDALLAIPRWLYKKLTEWATEGLQYVLGDWQIYNISDALVNVYATAGWAIDVFELQYGLQVTVTAIITRFLFSMIPFIGR